MAMNVTVIQVDPGVQPPTTYKITVDGADYTIKLRWNARESVMVMDIADANLNLLVLGAPLRANRPVLADFNTSGLPRGDFWVLDINGKGEPTQDGFGSEFPLVYIDAPWQTP